MNNLKHITIDCRMYGKNFGGIGRYIQEIVQHLINQKLFYITVLANNDAYDDLSVYQNEGFELIKCSFSPHQGKKENSNPS